MKNTLNLKELSEHIDVSLSTMVRMIEDGRFPVEPIKGTKPNRWYIGSVQEWLENKR